MRLLLDQNLSRHLVRQLTVEFPGSEHVTGVGLDTATDVEIWEYAADQGLVIVSKDSDCRQLAFLNGPPPKFVWLRLGNVSTLTLLETLRSHRNTIAAFSASADEALLVIPST